MKVLAISASPHKGNTYERVEQLREALQDLGGLEFEHIALADVNLEPCRGCFRCFVDGERSCPLKDDSLGLVGKMSEADAVVFATPVYSMHVSYLLKRFVDRHAYTFHRPRYFGKYAVGLAVTGGMGLDEALGYVRMFSGSWGFEYVGDLRYIDPPRGTNLPRLLQEKDRTDETARRLHRLISEKPPRRLTFKDYLQFHAMREVYGRSAGFLPTDHAYWKGRGWLDPGVRYFTPDSRGNPLFLAAARAAAWMLGRKIGAAAEVSRAGGGRSGE